MPWKGFSGKWYNLLKANEDVQSEIESNGITFDYDRMKYVDSQGNIVPSEQIAQMRREMMAERGYGENAR